ncbi:site-specific DNA-methyltransferase [Methanococcus maripaludis]|uniref:Type III restriction-modification system methyltransferase n=1 Tax=Methanococcus maripaludis OS7 TaxID=637915 RepID=A0A2Z5PSJ0_METMI|nr:site-specific DNA-methyltransferase [Methanococcus maripaludis]BAP62907.1 type III restriction-modification system methyltransferase [Methanococcus maripaludis OS7]
MVEFVSKESENLINFKIEELKKILPEVFSDGKIDFERLRLVLGDEITNDGEKYSFNWLGRKESFKNIQTTAKGTLVPCREESVNFDETENVFIEGDNLEVLKLLQKSYFNKIKVIYIDPPYNTGKDFIYKDNFKEGINVYLEQTGQINEEGFKLTTNVETSGRFHSDWLSMMYPRLFIARNLLKDDGVIFVSIDDNEVHNLRMIMNEIFGEENFVAEIVWRKTDNQANIGNIARVKEYILCYSKNSEIFKLNKMQLTDRALREYRYSDETGKFRRSILLHKTRGRHNYTVETPSGNQLNGPWMIPKKDFEELNNAGGIYWTRGGNEQPYGKIYLENSKGQISNDFLGIEFGTNQEAGLQLESLFGVRCFPFPKPTSLLKHIITIGSNPGDIVLDFFGGSGTTAQSVLELNNDEKSLNRKFILIQLPEPTAPNSETFKAGFKNIAELTKERIKKSIININSNEGFKVFKLARSNYRIWEKYNGNNESELKQQLKLFKDPLISNYNNEDVIFECIIKEGYSLNSKITLLDIRTNEVYKVIDEDKTRDKDSYFYICLDQKINNETIVKINPKKEDIVICLDTALDDSLKKNISIQCNLKVI